MKIAVKLILLILFPFLTGVLIPQKEADFLAEVQSDFNPEHLDGAFTGGFGEQTCHSCHFDYDLNKDGGSLNVDGVLETFEPGKVYEISVTVESEQLEVGGFQMSARFEDGTQAGSFDWEGNRLMHTPGASDEVKYLQHSAQGTTPTNEDERSVSWSFRWLAPESDQPVIFNIAANAGNYDDSSFGDWIYTKEIPVTSSMNQE